MFGYSLRTPFNYIGAWILLVHEVRWRRLWIEWGDELAPSGTLIPLWASWHEDSVQSCNSLPWTHLPEAPEACYTRWIPPLQLREAVGSSKQMKKLCCMFRCYCYRFTFFNVFLGVIAPVDVIHGKRDLHHMKSESYKVASFRIEMYPCATFRMTRKALKASHTVIVYRIIEIIMERYIESCDRISNTNWDIHPPIKW